MKIKIKFDNPNIKLGHDGNFHSNPVNNKPDEAAFMEIDMGLLYMAYRMFPPQVSGNNNLILPTLPYQKKQTHEGNVDISKYIPATGHDIYNYIARLGAANFQIQIVMKLDGRLDRDKLLKAVRLSIDSEPVFGCRFIEHDPPYWKPLDNLDMSKFCSFERSDNPVEAIRRFLESPLDMDKDPLVKLRLISSGQNDTLCLKINHTCCDGTGAKEYIKLLTDIYSYLDDDKTFTPQPSTRTRRDQDRLFNALGISDPESAWTGELEAKKNLWAFPFTKSKPETTRVFVAKLPNGLIDTLYRYGKSKGATVNDILVTAYYRAMFEISQPQYGVPMNISMTVDLRRYLPDQKTEAIRCFSGGIDTKLARVPNETFEQTLARVVAVMNEVKHGRPGLQSAVGLERVERAIFHETLDFYRKAGQYLGVFNKFAPILSNLGYLDKSLMKFGKITATDAYVVPPAIIAPGFLLCIGTYNGIITMSVSYYESQFRRENIERILSQIRKELIEGCRN